MQKNKITSNLQKYAVYASALFAITLVIYIIGYVFVNGIPQITSEISKYFAGTPSLFDAKYSSENVSIIYPIINTLMMIVCSLSISSILGISTAIYLVEYAKSDSKIVGIIRITAETLSGIPSIIYGLFGMLFFVKFLGFGYSLKSGILTVSIMILPLIIRATEEALKSVPKSYREASFGLGAGKLRTITTIILPSASSGILAGIILSIGRIVGETAALMYTAGTATNLATNIDTSGRTLSVHMYMLTSEGLHVPQAYATASILLLVVLLINGLSNLLAKKLTKNRT